MLCRICLLPEKKCFNMFNSTKDSYFVPSIISKHFWFEPQFNDEISDLLCFECWEKIKNFHEFYIQIESVQELYKQNVTIKKEISEEVYEVKSHEKDEINTSILHENIDSTVLYENNDETIWHENIDSMSSDSSASATNKSDCKKSESQSELKNLQMTEKKNSVRKEKPISRAAEEFNKKVSNFLTLSCDLCSETMPTLIELKNHFKKTHKIPWYVMCCDKKFSQNQFLNGHIDSHLNPENYKCTKCDRTLSTEKNYKKHMEKKHLKKIEYSCDSCPRKFEAKISLERHLPIHWPKDKWKVKCTYCERMYPTEHFMKNHVNDVHKKSKICHFCGKSFSSRKLSEHQRRVHEATQSKVQCNVCQAWLKSKTGLRIHMKNHQEALDEHKCDICGKISPNKGALKIHIKNHQTERCHLCSVCKKGFKRPLALRQHMASHTGESLYQCKYCTKTFIYDSAYHTHKKKEHLHEFLKEKKDIQRTNFVKFVVDNQELSGK